MPYARRYYDPDALTPSELQVLKLVFQGYTDEEVATKIGSRHTTVKCHMLHVRAKMDVSNRTSAIYKALQIGILEVPPCNI